jgi:hypothetical protein
MHSWRGRRPEPDLAYLGTDAVTLVSRSSMRLTALSVLVLFASPVLATERYWIARTAELVVFGQLRITSSYPMLDGWHFRGRIRVEEVLLGQAKLGEELSYSFVCNGCPYWPRPNVESYTLALAKGIWFLQAGKNGDWSSAGGSFDPGGQIDSPAMREFLRRRNAGSEPSAGALCPECIPPPDPWWKINLNRCWNHGLQCFAWR